VLNQQKKQKIALAQASHLAKVFLCFGSSVRTCRFGVVHDCRLKLKDVMKKAAQRICVVQVAAFTPRVCGWRFVALTILGLATLCQAATKTWEGDTSTDWANNANWTGGQPAGGDIAVFNAATTFQPTIFANKAAGEIDFLTSGWTISESGARTFQVNNIEGIVSSGSGQNSISVTTFILNKEDLVFNTASGNTLSFSGTTTFNANDKRLVKIGAGTVIFPSAFTAGKEDTITVNAGAVRIGATANAFTTLRLRGGVFEGSGTGTFSRTIGTGTAQNINWTDTTDSGSGGFAANGGTLTVQLNSGTATLTWNGAGTSANFVRTGGALVFGSETANSMVDFQNGIDLNGAPRTITVNDNANSPNDFARISGVLSGTGSSGLVKDGTGTLELTANNTYAGGTTLSGGTLRLGGGISGTIPDGSQMTFAGGTLSANDKVEVIGGLSLTANSAITLGTATVRQDLTFASASRSGGQLTINNWVGTVNGGANATEDRILFTTPGSVTADFLASVQFAGFGLGAHLVNGNELAPLTVVPEPTTVFAGCFLIGIFGWTERKRLRRLFPRCQG